MNGRRALVLLCIVIFAAVRMATAQQNQIEVISELQGLSDNRIHSFYKDRQGFVWIGTANGLNRYDGQSFRIFSPAATHDVLSNEFINSITEDASGNLWIGTRGGLNMLNAQRDSLVVYRPGAIASGQNEKIIPSAWIWDAAIAADGKLWLAPDGRDLTCFDPATASFCYYPWLAFAKASMPERTNPYFSIRRIVAKSVNEWWLGTNAGLYSFNMATGAFSFYGGENGGDVGVLEYDSASAMVYFAQESGSLYRFDLQANRLTRWTTGQLEALAENQFTDASLLHGRYIPMKKYLVRFQGNGEMPEVILMKNLMESGDKYASATKVFTDDQHIKWIATDNGVLKFDPAVNLFHFVKVLGENSGRRVNAVFYDRVSEKYFAASPFTNSLMLINAKTHERNEIRQIDGVVLTDCAAVNEEDDTWLWILTRGNLFRYNRKTGQFSRFPAPADVRDFLFVEMVKDAEGNLWFATTNGGLFVYLTAEKRWWHPAEGENFYDRYVTSLCHDEQHGAVWIGTYDFGLFRYDLERDTFAYFDSQPSDAHQLHSSLIFDLEQDQSGNIWVATNSGGLSMFSYRNPKDKPFTNFNLATGLSENTILAAQCDLKNRLWLLTYRELMCMSDSGRIIRRYPLDVGFGYSDFGVLTSMADNGTLLIPVSNGFVHFHPDSIEPKPYSFPVVIKRISVNGNEIALTGKEKFTFPYHRNSIEVSFAALNFSRPTEIRYEYILEGADEGWNSTGGVTTLKFPNLSDGKYTLLLRARDGSGALSSNSASFAFCIEPPFWKSYWFLATAICLTGILLYSYYRSRLNKLTELQKVRNKIAADLHDDIGSTLSSIRMYSEMVKSQIPGTSPAAAHMLDKISSNARESVESMSDIVWMINPKSDSVANLIDRMELYATEMCSGKNMELDFQKGDAPDGIRIPMETRKDIYLIFKEAVNNSVKYSGASRLTVLLERTDHRIKLEVADNGSGFDVSAIRRGNGLENMMQRAKTIGGEVRIESSVESGTCITFSAGIP